MDNSAYQNCNAREIELHTTLARAQYLAAVEHGRDFGQRYWLAILTMLTYDVREGSPS